jgi:hypothetical protein
MFCPQRKAEYCPGFSRCSDCGVDLVYELPPQASRPGAWEPEGPQDGVALGTIWEGDSESECVGVCEELKNAGIWYRVSQIPGPRDLKMVINWRYEIAVSSSDYERAREFLGLEDEATDGEDQVDQAALELPAAENSTADETVGGDSYLGKWYPEDATVEVWSQSAENTSSVVELSLKESLIRFRSHSQDGTRKFFVFPEDESRAREIVREIRDSTPRIEPSTIPLFSPVRRSCRRAYEIGYRAAGFNRSGSGTDGSPHQLFIW